MKTAILSLLAACMFCISCKKEEQPVVQHLHTDKYRLIEFSKTYYNSQQPEYYYMNDQLSTSTYFFIHNNTLDSIQQPIQFQLQPKYQIIHPAEFISYFSGDPQLIFSDDTLFIEVLTSESWNTYTCVK